MAVHEGSIPPQKVWIRSEFLYDGESHHGEFSRGVMISVRCIPGQAALFQVLLENGVLRDKLPISAICHERVLPARPFHHLQLWNCFSSNFSIVELSYLCGLRVDVRMKDGTWEPGNYLWTIQWGQDGAFGVDLSLAEDPAEHKSAHFIELKSGEFALQPNNRLRWYEPSFVTVEFPQRPDYKVNTKSWNCEAEARWVTSNDSRWAYDIKEGEASLEASSEDALEHPPRTP